ncbi:MAG TPA: hypothetical protein VGK63_00250 [Candidatus Limnocylindrales bacterium]
MLQDERARIVVAGDVVSALKRVEQLVRWSTEKANSLPSWEGWADVDTETHVSRLLVVRWTRANREAAKAASPQLRLAYPVDPDDAVDSLTGTASWPGTALIWSRTDRGAVRLVGGR